MARESVALKNLDGKTFRILGVDWQAVKYQCYGRHGIEKGPRCLACEEHEACLAKTGVERSKALLDRPTSPFFHLAPEDLSGD